MNEMNEESTRLIEEIEITVGRMLIASIQKRGLNKTAGMCGITADELKAILAGEPYDYDFAGLVMDVFFEEEQLRRYRVYERGMAEKRERKTKGLTWLEISEILGIGRTTAPNLLRNICDDLKSRWTD